MRRRKVGKRVTNRITGCDSEMCHWLKCKSKREGASVCVCVCVSVGFIFYALFLPLNVDVFCWLHPPYEYVDVSMTNG